jgi:hypothetical protein
MPRPGQGGEGEGRMNATSDKSISTKRIGDGKLPNKYWVSIANDYYYLNTEEQPGRLLGCAEVNSLPE